MTELKVDESVIIMVMIIGCFILIGLGHNGQVINILSLITGYLTGKMGAKTIIEKLKGEIKT